MKTGRLIILLVEDEENDVLFVQQATKKGSAGHIVHSVHHAEEAIHYLRGEGKYADRNEFPLPNVILTDLKMPRMNGFEFLRWLRSHPECSIIPTIVFSSSHLEADVKEAYRLGASSYIAKPRVLDELEEILRVIYEYWSRCECPPASGG